MRYMAGWSFKTSEGLWAFAEMALANAESIA
jgi:hypothetical protein